MNKRIAGLISVLICSVLLLHAEPVVVGEDDAAQAAYNDGWNGGTNGGSGFEAWTLQCYQEENSESHAGFYIATGENNTDMGDVASNGKAFGFFANGAAFETASAYRQFASPLQAGDSFSFLLKAGPIQKKFDNDDPQKGAIGLTLRSDNLSATPDDYNKEARFEFGWYEGASTYQIYDGETSHDTGVAWAELGVSVTLTLVTADTYEVEITTLGDKKTTTLPVRKLGGSAGADLVSFCVFNRDGERNDAYFNGFQIAKQAK